MMLPHNELPSKSSCDNGKGWMCGLSLEKKERQPVHRKHWRSVSLSSLVSAMIGKIKSDRGLSAGDTRTGELGTEPGDAGQAGSPCRPPHWLPAGPSQSGAGPPSTQGSV